MLALPVPTADHSFFLECSGWDPRFDLPLGNPIGPSSVGAGGIMRRTFESGVKVQWNTSCAVNPRYDPYQAGHQCASVSWPGVSPPPPNPRPLAPWCPGDQCLPVPEANYLGCYYDRLGGKFDLPISPPESGGESVERCNSLCASRYRHGRVSTLGYKYFGVQAGHACFCGNSYGSMGRPHLSYCNSSCLANPKEICGGSSMNSVYKTVPIG